MLTRNRSHPILRGLGFLIVAISAVGGAREVYSACAGHTNCNNNCTIASGGGCSGGCTTYLAECTTCDCSKTTDGAACECQ